MLLHTFLLVFIAEMADKTQLMVMALTNKYSMRNVVLGMMGGVFIISGLSVLAGDLIGDFIPMELIKLGAGAMFLIFGMSNLRPNTEESAKNYNLPIPMISISLTFILAELGDKTQLATVALAANHMEEHFFIFLGASFGLIMANLFGIFAGKFIFSHFRESSVKIVSSFIFFVFGSLNIFEVLQGTIVIICIYSVILILCAYKIFMHSQKVA